MTPAKDRRSRPGGVFGTRWSPGTVWLGTVLLRIMNAVLLRTYFDPDEHWQALEVAHHWVFGYGWLTWEWQSQMRSILYPALFGLYYKLLALAQWDRIDSLLDYGPRVLQGVLAGTVDLLTFLVAIKFTGSLPCAKAALFASLISWCNLAYATRTLSNNLETLLSLLTILLWPVAREDARPRRILGPLALLGLAVLIRPSAAVNWVAPILGLVCSARGGIGGRIRLLGAVGVVAAAVIAVGAGVDRLYYGRWVLSWWNFVRFNVVDGLSSFYGTHPWHFYLTQTLPAIAGPMLPLCLLGLAFDSNDDRLGWLLRWLAGSLFFSSLIPHKEIRFMLPVGPILAVLAGAGYRLLPRVRGVGLGLRRSYLLLVLLSSLALGVYLGRMHGAGPLATIEYLRGQVDASPRSVADIYFAMPCHSTPFQASLHRASVRMDFVTCEPPSLGYRGDLAAYRDQSDLFYAQPIPFLASILSARPTTTHVVLFEALLGTSGMRELLQSHGLAECWRHFNTHWHPDPRRAGDILVYCRSRR